ncbi:PREDICTED: probable glucuronoxylan glucuronosyltransferase F8H [Tarenaya hassleriana]|uniref:probable glucuronoxylan glucuronosyltransferase F8H n=1 Tax=Tarenaya hassleriana TaxID=28532 RepID=UPI00053C47F8|nr:PREDICTED: probable glucuronoxylan glucuronosyltransferase F8H [Tarenaya hassleriana]
MSLEIKRACKNKGRMGVIVRMQVNHRGRTSDNKKSFVFVFFFFFRNYYKWVLWFFLSLYLFTSCFVGGRTSSPSSSGSVLRTRLSSNRVSSSSLQSRALIESSAVNATSMVRPGAFKGMKIYIYDLPEKYNSDWVASSDRCATHLFAAEVSVHRALLSAAAVRTTEPEDADFFFLPVYVSCNFSTSNGFPSLGHARSLLRSAVDYVATKHPFWNRTRGSDHIFVASHDFGACFHAMENKAIEDGIPEFMKNSIILQTFGVTHDHPCQDVEHVVIPPYIPPESLRRTLDRAPANGRRDIWAFFRGKMEVNPKNISGHFYGKGVRTVILKKFAGDRRFYLRRRRFAGYQSEIVRSVFCLCPLGWAPWSPRLVESVVLGCVPVLIADGIRLPFPEIVRWPEISLTVAEKDVGDLRKVLGRVAASNLSVVQSNLNDPAVKGALLYNVPMREGDATWHILEALSSKLDRSYRRSMVSNQ